jgi:hypothetical protein
MAAGKKMLIRRPGSRLRKITGAIDFLSLCDLVAPRVVRLRCALLARISDEALVDARLKNFAADSTQGPAARYRGRGEARIIETIY